ncbi:MAG: F0F1 ATP synthase subunit alpha [Omnitrophica WOR_2 bacterium GWA2_47_8]|nr:MAG: F0F1 ATP synthase subunit alpha [Omnitrophica WOR_2 bacterium GWA2_47_8]
MAELRYTEEGKVKVIRGCIVMVEGFKSCINGQVIRFGYGTRGIIVGFDRNEAQVLIIRQQEQLRTGDRAVASLEPLVIPVGEKFIGRIVNPLGEPMDGLGTLRHDALYPIFIEAPSILTRKELDRTLETGIKVIDCMIPVGWGQRELILGDKMTGKTTICTDTIINQKTTGVKCVYCAIGKSASSLGKVVQLFLDKGCFDYTSIVAATASAPPGQLYLAPYVACAIAEFFRAKGENVFIAFDDFTKHAWAYREISLLLGRAPGRDSYPGDIFYLHSKMIERACYMKEELGGGSITFFPIVETLEGDLTGYVQSNLVSMTDGQIYLSTPLFGEGQKPAVDLGLSVSRVGSKVQWKAIKKLSGPLRLEYLQYREVMRVSKLKTSGQSEEMQSQLKGGEILTQILIQDKDSPIPIPAQVIILFAYGKKILHELTMEEVGVFQKTILDYFKKVQPEAVEKLMKKHDVDEEMAKIFEKTLKEYLEEIKKNRPKEEDLDVEGSTNVGVDALDKATTKK